MKKLSKAARAYLTQVKTKGKFVTVGEALPKGLALLRGAKITTGTLAATFRVVPTKRATSLQDIRYVPSSQVFRTYAYRKGGRIKIPLKNTYIQKTGLKELGVRTGRLTSLGERTEIQKARKRSSSFKRQGRIKWL